MTKIVEQLKAIKDEDIFLITYYAKKYRAKITRKGKIDDISKIRCIWTTPKGNLCFCYHDLDAETEKPYRTATNPLKIERVDV